MRLYEFATIILGVLFLSSVITDKIASRQDRKELKKSIENSVLLSNHVVTLSSNNLQSSQKINSLLEEKGKIEEKFEKQLQEQDKKVGEQFGLLASQAQTIATTTPASDTIKHLETSKQFMQLHNGILLDQGLAWNQSFINNYSQEYELLKQQLEETKKENQKLQVTLEKESSQNVVLATKLQEKSIDLEKTVGKTQLIENTLYAQKNWTAKIKQILYTSVILTIIGALCYGAFHLWQYTNLKKQVAGASARAEEEANKRREANKIRYELEKHSDELKTSIKTFFNVDDLGNSTMANILKSYGLAKHFEDLINKNKEEKNS